jgi:hypothetical protein
MNSLHHPIPLSYLNAIPNYRPITPGSELAAGRGFIFEEMNVLHILLERGEDGEWNTGFFSMVCIYRQERASRKVG